VSDGIPDPNALVPQEVVVTLKDGTVQRWHCAVMPANPARRLTREQHLTKFRRCLDFAREPLRPGTSDTIMFLAAVAEHGDVESVVGLHVRDQTQEQCAGQGRELWAPLLLVGRGWWWGS
jgi:hypothetical protein